MKGNSIIILCIIILYYFDVVCANMLVIHIHFTTAHTDDEERVSEQYTSNYDYHSFFPSATLHENNWELCNKNEFDEVLLSDKIL